MDFDQIRQAIIEAGRRLYAKNMVAANDGNISARLPDGTLMVTPTGICKGDLTPEQLLVVDMQGQVISGQLKPTSEIKLHLAAYRKRLDIMAIVHAHPRMATAYAVVNQELDRIALPEVIFTLGRILLVPYGTPSTDQLPHELEKLVMDADTFLLANHGTLTLGRSVMDAYFKTETLEHYAAIMSAAHGLGGARYLNREQEIALYAVRSEVFGIDDQIKT